MSTTTTRTTHEYECAKGHRYWSDAETDAKCPTCYPPTVQCNDGGPAFPGHQIDHTLRQALIDMRNQERLPISLQALAGLTKFDGGMTLRDWFAGQALAGILASEGGPLGGEEASLAKTAYYLANAMLAARNASTT